MPRAKSTRPGQTKRAPTPDIKITVNKVPSGTITVKLNRSIKKASVIKALNDLVKSIQEHVPDQGVLDLEFWGAEREVGITWNKYGVDSAGY